MPVLPLGLKRLYNKRLREHARTATPRETVRASVEVRGAELTVRFGNRGFFLRAPAPIETAETIPDSAVLGLAIQSMSHNIEIHLDQPVTPAAAGILDRLGYANHLWMMPGNAPLRLRHEVGAPAPLPATRQDKVLCLSGGVDSTQAGIEAITDHGYTHGLLVAGADYAGASEPGFVDLKARVTRIADRLGLDLLVVETDLRQQGMNWNMLHSVNLAMCLNALQPRLAEAAIAMDNSLTQQLTRHPWGNCSELVAALSSEALPIRPLGERVTRVQKVGAIAAHDPALLDDLSVCYRDTSTGGNCGRCEKCIRTRLAMVCLGLDQSASFPATEPLEDLVPTLKVSRRSAQALRGQLVVTNDLLRHMPPGPLHDRLADFERRVLERLLAKLPAR